MAEFTSAEASLDALESCVNALLLQTGSVLSDPSNFENRRLFRTSTIVKQHVPTTVGNVQQALASLERELGAAKAVLLRDLKDHRRLRDKPKSMSPQIATPQESPEPLEGSTTGGSPIPAVEANKSTSPDVVMLDSPESIKSQPQASQSQVDTTATAISTTTADEQSKSTEQDQTTTTIIARNKEPDVDDGSLHMDTTEDRGDRQATDPNVDFRQPSPTSNVSISRSGVPDLQADMTRSQAVPNVQFPQAGVGSLLPGLENYANDDGQDPFGDIAETGNFSSANTFAGTNYTNEPGGTEGVGQQEDVGGAPGLVDGSSFEDLFNFGEFGAPDGNSAQGTFDDSQFGAEFFNI